MGSEVPEFRLKWNNHHSVLVSVLDTLLEREKLVDVTLAAEGQFLNVHRLVLFACSQYFEDLLSQQPDKPAVVFLKDVRFNDLKALVEYMYKGEVNVSENRLAAFLETAEALKIKGLVNKKQDNSNDSHSEPKVPQQQPEQQKVLKVKSTSQQNVIPVKKMPISVNAPDCVKSIQQTPADPLPTKSMAIEQPKETQESALPLELDTMEGDENVISLATKKDSEMTELIIEDDQFETTEQQAQDAEDDDRSNSRDEINETHSGVDNSQANPSEAEEEHNGDSPSNPTAGPSRPKRKAASMSTSIPPATRVKYGWKDASSGTKCSCGKVYTHKPNYYRHKKYECGLEPSFACSVEDCGQRFHQKSNLKTHLNRVHKVLLMIEN